MKLRKLLALILVSVMLIPFIVSCEKEPANTGDDSSKPDATVQTDENETTDDGTLETISDPDSSAESTQKDPATETEPDTDKETGGQTDKETNEVTETNGDETTSAPTTTDKETETTTDKVTETTSEQETEPEQDLAKASDLMFRQVFGSGLNNDAPARYSFIELFNTSELPCSLKGLAIYSYDSENKTYVSKEFPDVTVPASTSYLIRCAEAKGKQGADYKTTGERLSISYYDLDWDVVLDNKEIQLAIADKGKNFGNAKVSSVAGVYIYFIGTQTVTSDKNAALGISKTKAAFRSSADEKYVLVDYKNAPASEIMDHAPMCMSGDLNGLASAAANVVTFSHKAGVYNTAFDLTLTAADGYTIYYTTDGSDPREKGVKYTGAIKMESSDAMPWGDLTKLCKTLNETADPSTTTQIGGRVIKAYATDGNKNKTQVATNTYFISKKLLSYKTLVISISLKPEDFLSEDKGIYHIQMADPYGTKLRRTSYTEIFESNGERVSASYTEISMNGYGSLTFQAKPLRIYFKSDAEPGYVGNPSKLKYDIFQGQARDGVTEYKRLVLRNSGNDSSKAHLRDGFLQRLCSTLKVATTAYRPSLLFINGEFWGVYNVRERYDQKYFESHFGIPEEDLCILEAPSPLTTERDYNVPYVLNEGNEGDEKPFHDLVAYIETTDLSSDAKFKYVSDRIDIDNMIDFFVGSIYLSNWDWPMNNIKVWRNKNADNKEHDTKWRFVFCDMDMGAALVVTTNMFKHSINDDTVAGRMFNHMLQNETFKNKFIERFYECAETVFSPGVALPILTEMCTVIKNIMPLHFARWPGDNGSMETFESQIRKMRSFIKNRAAKAIPQLEEFLNVKPQQYAVMFDEDTADVTVDGEKITSGYTTKVNVGKKVLLSVSLKQGYELLGIECTDADGNLKTYTKNDVSLNITSAMNIVVTTKKTGTEYTPSVVTGTRSVFAVSSNGVLFAWGENESGQLGILSNTVTEPVPVFSNVAKVATSMSGAGSETPMTAVLTSTGEVYTSGSNSAGQLGREGSTVSFIKLNLGFKAKDIACGHDHMLIVAENGDMYGVGNNTYGQLGRANFGKSVTALRKLDSNVRMVAAGRRHTVYIKDDGALYALGDNRWNKIKAGENECLKEPLKLGDGFSFVSAGHHNTLAVKDNGDLYYIGYRSVTTFNAEESAGEPVKIASNIKAAYIQDEHIIMLGRDGKVFGFGLNDYNQISRDGNMKSSPYRIMDGCVACGAGTYYSAAVKADGSLILWGNNTSGVIGNGAAEDSNEPEYTAINLK